MIKTKINRNDAYKENLSLLDQLSFQKTIKEKVVIESNVLFRKPNLEDHFQTGGLSYETGI